MVLFGGGRGTLELCDLRSPKYPRIADVEFAELERTDGLAAKLFHPRPDSLEHAADLLVASFADAYVDPALAAGMTHLTHVGRRSCDATESHAGAKHLDRLARRARTDLDGVALLDVEA